MPETLNNDHQIYCRQFVVVICKYSLYEEVIAISDQYLSAIPAFFASLPYWSEDLERIRENKVDEENEFELPTVCQLEIHLTVEFQPMHLVLC